MKKLFIIALAMMMFVLVGCDKTTPEKDDDVLDNDKDVIVDDTENPDEAKDDTETPDDGESCTLDSEWMQPEDGWSSWAYLKMMGPIGDYDGEYAAAVFTDGKIKLTSGTTDFADGSYMNYQSQILLADAAAYEFTDVDQAAGTAVVDYWDAMYQFSLQLIPLMKEEGATEAGFGATVTFRHTYIDVEFDASGAVTSQEVRKNCYLAVSNTEEMEEEGETYDVPIGDMFGCFGDNTDASVGEDLKMMFKNDMTEDQAALLEFFNTQTDGSVLAYGDEGFQHVCMCYEADGTEVDCWAYDGPGGAEECPDYVSEEDCKVPVTDDVTDDKDDTDDADDTETDVVPDDDTPVVPCDPNPCTSIVGSDGVCTADGSDYNCGCTANYAWNSVTKECTAGQQIIDCNNTIPANSSYTGTGKFTQTWDGDSWEPATSSCEWECDTNYVEETGACVFGTRRTDCTNIPANATGTGLNDDGKFEQTWNGISWDPATFTCTWACDANYTDNSGTCEADTKKENCTNIPANAHGINDNSDGMFKQTWDGTAWDPATATCEWDCDKGYMINGTNDGCDFVTTLYVNAEASGAETGYNWTDAFTELSDALNNAADGQEIWVAAGTYTPQDCPYQHDCSNVRDMHFGLVSGVAILGGFDGTETLETERDPDANVVVVSGDVDGDDSWNDTLKEWENRTDNIYNVFRTAWGETYTLTTVIDGVTIKGGHADITADPGQPQNTRGGGIALEGDALTINACKFTGNYGIQGGGAIFADEGSELVVKNSIFTRNTTLVNENDVDYANGGAIHIDKGSLTITDCEFIENRSKEAGAINIGNSTSTISGTLFTLNYAAKRAGAVNKSDWDNTLPESSMTISDSYFYQNETSVSGTTYQEAGALYVQGGVLTVTNTDFEENVSVNSPAVNLSEPAVGTKFTNCDFINNVVTYIEHGDNSVVHQEAGEVTFESCDFTGNYGGGVRTKEGDAFFNSCLFYDNTGSMGAGINVSKSNVVVNDSVFDSNDASVAAGDISGLGGAVAIIGVDFENGSFADGKSVIFNNVVFVGNTASTWGGAVIDVYYPETVYNNCSFFNNTDGSGDAVVLASSGFDSSTGSPDNNGAVYNNSIIWDSVAVLEGDLGGGMMFGPSAVTFNHCDVMGSGGSAEWNETFMNAVMGSYTATATDGGGNIDVDPEFSGLIDDPLKPLSFSPCINAGDNTLVPVTMTEDLIGNARIQETTVDMGAYEVTFNDPCDPDPCSGGTPNCVADSSENNYTCYPDYTVGWCIVQWPKTATGYVGEPLTVYGRVWVDGVTNVTQDAGDPNPRVKGQWGVSEMDSDPTSAPGDFSWDDAAINMAGGEGNNDEYMYDAVPPMAGTYYYAYRFSADGGDTWSYCDVDGLWAGTNGVATVSAVPNGGFETWNEGEAASWNGASGVEAREEENEAHSGNKSVKLTRIEDDNAATEFMSDFIPVIAEEDYAASAWFLDTNDEARGRVIVRWYSDEETELEVEYGGYSSDNADWAQVVYAVTAPVGATLATVSTRVYSDGGITTGGYVYMDDVDFVVAP